MDLGKLVSVEARKVWKNEARHFTPWLADNIELLSESIGIDLEIENTEVSAGPYSVDILAKDIETNRYAIIENQIEKTNHDHLGKSITYASVLDADTVIWIASDFTAEHKKALDWLNDNTTDKISFFGVQLEVWKIDDSKEAVKFNVICRPNTAVRRARSNQNSLTEARLFQQNFWTILRESLVKTKKIPSLPSPLPQFWYNISLGKSGIEMSNTCNTQTNTVGIRVYIHGSHVEKYLKGLTVYKKEIEDELGFQTKWDPFPEKKDRIIVIDRQFDLDDETGLNDAVNWMTEYTIKFREVFMKFLKNI